MLFLLHSTLMIITMHTNQLHVSQLHAVDMLHARTDARTATVTPHALPGLGFAGRCRPLRHCREDEMW